MLKFLEIIYEPKELIVLTIIFLQDLSYYELCQQYPSEVDKLQQLDSGICGGASANVALILGGKLYVTNVGKFFGFMAVL